MKWFTVSWSSTSFIHKQILNDNIVVSALDSNPSTPSGTVVRAHVHPPPSESGGNRQAAATLPAEASAPLVPAVKQDAPLPEPVSDPAQMKAKPIPSTPPPPLSPETVCSPPRQREIVSHQEPVENSESDIQDVSGYGDASPNKVTGRNVVDSPQPAGPVEQCEDDTQPQLEGLQSTTPIKARPPRSPAKAETKSDMTGRSPVNMKPPEKPPVQDTTPLTVSNSAAVLQPKETPKSPAAQVNIFFSLF